VKQRKNTKGSQNSKSYPTLNIPKDGRGKWGTKNGARINQGSQEMTEDAHNSFQKPNQGDAEETKEENKEEWNCNEFKGFHDSLAFKGNCFYQWDGNIQECPFAEWNCDKFAWKANLHGRPLFSGMGNCLFLMTGMVTTPQSQVIANGTAIFWRTKLLLPRGTATAV
jgi:hypothetical protein